MNKKTLVKDLTKIISFRVFKAEEKTLKAKLKKLIQEDRKNLELNLKK